MSRLSHVHLLWANFSPCGWGPAESVASQLAQEPETLFWLCTKFQAPKRVWGCWRPPLLDLPSTPCGSIAQGESELVLALAVHALRVAEVDTARSPKKVCTQTGQTSACLDGSEAKRGAARSASRHGPCARQRRTPTPRQPCGRQTTMLINPMRRDKLSLIGKKQT